MAVEIDIDLDASGATGKIGQIAASLKGLEMVANDIEIDFDADIGEISDEIEDFADALGDLEVGNLSFVDDLDNKVDKLDEVLDKELDLNVSGGTNNSDSTGSDPPIKVSELTADFPTFSESTVRSETDGGEGANLFDRNYGPNHTLMEESDVEQLFKFRNSVVSNLGKNAPGYDSTGLGDPRTVGTRTGFGNDPVSMDWKRDSFDISFENSADPDSKPLGRRAFLNVAQRVARVTEQDRGGISSAEVPRVGQVRNLVNLREVPTTVEEQIQALDEKAEQAVDGIEDHEFAFLNRERFDSELSPQEQLGAFKQSEIGGQDPMDLDMRPPDNEDAFGLDFSVGGSRNGRSNSEIIDSSRVLSKIDGVDSLSSAVDAVGDVSSGIGKKFRKIRPTMGKYMQLFAALIPVAVALGTQLLGVAAAMGSVAVAGGAILGLGLLGHAESLTGSVAEAEAQVRSLKQEMFETFQPTMQQFAPIQARAFDRAPEMLDPVAEEMEGLTAYEDTLFQLGGMLAGGMEKAVEVVVDNEEAISNLTTRFSALIGSGALKFFEWLIQAASKNQDLLVGLGREMIKLAVAAYNVSMAIAKVLTAFTPLFDLLVFISEILNSEIIIGLITMVAWLYVLGKAAGVIYALYAGFMTLASGIADAALMMFGYEMSTWGAVAATLALVAAIGMLTLGAATVIGGAVTAGAMGSQDIPGGSGSGNGRDPPPPTGGTTVINDNRSYQIDNSGNNDYASQKALEGTVRKVNEENSATSLPPVNKSSDTSDSPNSTN